VRRIVGGLDFETTGLDWEKGHRFCESALVLRDLDTGERIGRYVTRINPQRAIDADATAVHGIKFEDVVGAPLWEEVGPKLSALLSHCTYVVAHNGEGFDMPFMVHELLRIGAPLPEVRLVDTMLQGRWASPDGMVPNLGALCWACGVPYDATKAHAADYDVEVMLECFFQQLPRGFFTLPAQPFRLPVKETKK
jgi:DNA polymerase-3 subunit epsilon